MNRITYIGMDVHTTNYTLCAYTLQTQKPFCEIQIKPEFGALKKYLAMVDKIQGGNSRFLCGYEAGCLGYSLYKEITSYKWKDFSVECVIMAPTTMAASPKDKTQKSDPIDARRIAQCLCFGQYSSVYVPTEEDNAVKEFIRMRDDTQTMLKQTKQQILALCTRHGFHYGGKSYWTQKHMAWLETIRFSHALIQEAFDEYMVSPEAFCKPSATLDSAPKNAGKDLPATNSKAYALVPIMPGPYSSIFLRLAVKSKPLRGSCMAAARNLKAYNFIFHLRASARSQAKG